MFLGILPCRHFAAPEIDSKLPGQSFDQFSLDLSFAGTQAVVHINGAQPDVQPIGNSGQQVQQGHRIGSAGNPDQEKITGPHSSKLAELAEYVFFKRMHR
jgi:hypothetical protein